MTAYRSSKAYRTATPYRPAGNNRVLVYANAYAVGFGNAYAARTSANTLEARTSGTAREVLR